MTKHSTHTKLNIHEHQFKTSQSKYLKYTGTQTALVKSNQILMLKNAFLIKSDIYRKLHI